MQQINDLLTGQLDRLKSAYNIEADPECPWGVVLQPKSKLVRELLSRLILVLDPEKNVVTSVKFFEPSGDWTQIEFKNIEALP